MPAIHWILSQLASYPVAAWLLFITITFITTGIGRWHGMMIGQLFVALIVAVLDMRWIQSEMHKPDWQGQPDQDGLFALGVIIRVILINITLLPIAWLTLRIRQPRANQSKA